jgi:hypothetical protein
MLTRLPWALIALASGAIPISPVHHNLDCDDRRKYRHLDVQRWSRLADDQSRFQSVDGSVGTFLDRIGELLLTQALANFGRSKGRKIREKTAARIGRRAAAGDGPWR